MDILKVDDGLVARLSLGVYRIRLGPKDTKYQLEKDGDNGEKQAKRAMSYAPLVRAFLEALIIEGGSIEGASLVKPEKKKGKDK